MILLITDGKLEAYFKDEKAMILGKNTEKLYFI